MYGDTSFKTFRIWTFLIISILAFAAPVNAQMQTGSDTLFYRSDMGDFGGWEFYDFSSATAFGIDDTANIDADIRGTTNEGSNFGNEGAPQIEGRRIYLMGTGDVDTVTSAPEWTNAAPWVEVSWDFTDGTLGSPIEAGQLWAVYTFEGNYTVVEITEVHGVWNEQYFTFDYKYQSDGTRFFEESSGGSEIVSGSATSSNGSGFDFSREETADNHDAGDYLVDFVYVSNEGVNFGNEGSSSLSGTGRRFLLMGEGDIDTVQSVPSRTDAAPWVTVSYDFSDGTGGLPISVGQLWGVYTREGHYAVMEITGLPGGDFGSSFTFDYKYQPDGTRFFDGGGSTEPDPVYTFSVSAGNNQTVTTGETAPIDFSVVLTDDEDNLISGEGVTFEFSSVPGGAAGYSFLSSSTPSTGADGKASVQVQAGDLAGTYEITATLDSDNTKTVTFTLTVEEPVYVLAVQSGNNQTAMLNEVFPESLKVVLTDDEGAAVAGEGITFSFTEIPEGASGQSFLTSSSSETDSNGEAYVQVEAGNVAGVYEVTAALDSDTSESVTFTLTAEEPVYTLIKQSGDNQEVPLESTTPEMLYVKLTDQNDNPVEGEAINFQFSSVPEGAEGHGGLPEGATTTSEGIVRTNAIVGDIPGEYRVMAYLASDQTVNVIFTLTAVQQDPASLVVVSGDNQSAFPGDTLAALLEVAVEDGDGNSLDNITVKFEEVSIPENADTSRFFTSDGIQLNTTETTDGTATMNYILGSRPGDYTLKASLPNYPGVAEVLFNITGLHVAAPAAFEALSGAGSVKLVWEAAEGAAGYNIYRSPGDDNPASASPLTTVSDLSYTDTMVEPGQWYYYWVKSVDQFGNEGTESAGPTDAVPDEIPEPGDGEGMIVAISDGGFFKDWQYFDFSKGFASNQADTGDYLADIAGSSNEGVNFGRENAPQIEGNRIIRLEDGSLEEVTSIPEWTGESPWIGTSWESEGTNFQPVQEGQLWGVYTREGNYAVMEITGVPDAFGDTLRFKYKYQTGGTPVFGEGESDPVPDSMFAVSGNNQTGLPDRTLGQDLTVQVVDTAGNGVDGVTVNFSFTSTPGSASGHSLSAASVITSGGGFASTKATLGDAEGEYKVTAAADGLTASVVFSLHAEKALPPEAVELLEIRSDRSAQLMPLWTQSHEEEFLRYRIYMSTDGESFTLTDSTRRDGNPVDTARTISGLTNLAEYHFAITVVNNDMQESEFSNTMRGTPYPTPGTPQNFSVTVGDGAVQLNWSPVDTTHFSYYLVDSGLQGQGLNPTDTLWNVEDTTLVISNLTNGETYQFYVRVVNEFGREGFSTDWLSATPESAYKETNTSLASLINGVSSWGDFDNDGDLDLLMTGQADESSDPQAILYVNNGDGTFTDSNQNIEGVINSTIYWIDVDQNGFIDLVLSGETASASITKVYLNVEGVLTDAGFTLPGLGEGSVSPADYDNDGDLDFLVSGDNGTTLQTILVKNNGGGNFVPLSTSFVGVKNSSSAWGDYNSDGNLDLLLAGENANGNAVARIYRNEGNDQFINVDVSLQGVVNGTVAWSDFDLDTDQDILITGYTSTEQTSVFTGFYQNTGSGFSLFYSTTSGGPGKVAATGKRKSRAVVGDYDNDGDPDVLRSAATADGSVSSIFKNNRESIGEEELDLGIDGSVTWADYDGDGDLDIIATGNSADGATSKILANSTGIKNTAPAVPQNLMVSVSADSATLSWDASKDGQTPVSSLTYNVRIGTASGQSDILTANADLTTGQLRIPENGNAGYSTQMVLRDLPNGTYIWQVQAVDNGFMASPFAVEASFEVTSSPVSAEEEAGIPEAFELSQNYPNPFNPSTIIKFSLPMASAVKLEVFDITGRLVAILADRQMSAGYHTFTFNAQNLSSGMYFYRLRTNTGIVLTRKMMLIK